MRDRSGPRPCLRPRSPRPARRRRGVARGLPSATVASNRLAGIPSLPLSQLPRPFTRRSEERVRSSSTRTPCSTRFPIAWNEPRSSFSKRSDAMRASNEGHRSGRMSEWRSGPPSPGGSSSGDSPAASSPDGTASSRYSRSRRMRASPEAGSTGNLTTPATPSPSSARWSSDRSSDRVRSRCPSATRWPRTRAPAVSREIRPIRESQPAGSCAPAPRGQARGRGRGRRARRRPRRARPREAPGGLRQGRSRPAQGPTRHRSRPPRTCP